MRLCAWQKEKSEGEDKVDGKELHVLEPIGPSVTRHLSRDEVQTSVAGGGTVPRLGPIELIAFVFSVFTLYGCGAKPVLFGTIMLVLGIPIYVWQQGRRTQSYPNTNLR
jgi:hypothetical protein